MIYYFSGTGNSEWIAKEMAKLLKMEAINIVEINRDQKITIREGETVGFVCPIYAWKPAENMLDFMKNFTKLPNAFAFAIATCESEAGRCEKDFNKVLQMNSCYSIDMPNNYIISMAVDSEESIHKKINAAKESMKQISEEILERKSVCRVKKGSLSLIKSTIVANAFNKYSRKTDKFYVEEGCISCGLCEKKCPTNCITMVNGKPVWGENCLQCLSCINRCPKQVIQYGKKTKKQGRYVFKEINE